MSKISVIVPVYNEEEVVNTLYDRLISVVSELGMDYEFMFVNDGSSDKTLELVKALSERDSSVKFKSFSRNFGHQNAVIAGIEAVSGDCAVIIDADLQDPPELISELVSKWHEGYEVVYAQRSDRKGESIFKKVTAKLFYRILQRLSDLDIPLDTGDFRLIDRKVIEVMKQMPEKNKYIRGMVAWSGFRQIGVSYVREKRYAGSSKYPLRKMIRFGLNGVVSFSSYPLKIAAYFGFFVTLISTIAILWVLYLRFFTEKAIQGWTSIMLVVLFMGGVQLLCMGILGLYMSRMSEDVKRRPSYIIDEEN